MANGHLVYARKNPEAALCDDCMNENIIYDSDFQYFKKIAQEGGVIQQKYQSKESGAYFSPLAHAKLAYPYSGNVLASVTPEKLSVNSSLLDTSSCPLVDKTVDKKQGWEERSLQLHMFLRKLDGSNEEDHLKKLGSLSSAELSMHAVELEKKAIHLALEEDWLGFLRLPFFRNISIVKIQI